MFAQSIERPCASYDATNLTDRGSVTDTPCVVPSKKVLIENGYDYAGITGGGTLQYFPQVQVSFGLPAKTEFAVFFPSYNRQTQPYYSGFNAIGFGSKHELFYGQQSIVSIQAYFSPVSGSKQFGSTGAEVFMNGIWQYNISSTLSTTVFVGAGTLTQPSNSHGGRFFSINPSAVLSYAPNDIISYFIEGFSQTQPAPGIGFSAYADFGLIYTVRKNISIDVEVGRRFIQRSNGVEHFIGGGLTILLF